MSFFDKMKDLAKQAKDKIESNDTVKSFNLSETIDSAKKFADKAVQKAQDAYTKYKAELEARKVAEEEHRLAMESKCAEIQRELSEKIYAANTGNGLFNGTSKDKILSFTKEFAVKMVLPAIRNSNASLKADYLISDKEKKKITEIYKSYCGSETPLLTFRGAEGEYNFLSTEAIYFRFPLKEDKKYKVILRLDVTKVSSLNYVEVNDEDDYKILCNGVEVATFNSYGCDFDNDSMVEYLRAFRELDFVITDQEIDALIHRKIGNDIYGRVKKYMVPEEEFCIFFAWGLDTLTAKDYIICTTKQIIIMNRELFGMTADIKQFYYEEISSLNTNQNSDAEDLTTKLIDSALTSLLQQCDLVITMAGVNHVINTLNKVEAERVVALFHYYRKEAKNFTNQQVIIQQGNAEPDVLAQLEKLASLKDAGIITEEEFQAKKATLLTRI